MTIWTLLGRSLRYYARAHVGVLLGAAIGSAALVGALVVGDSVRESLRRKALESLGPFEHALAAGDRFFDASLSGRMAQAIPGLKPVSVLVLPAIVSSRTGGARANNIRAVGVAEDFLTAVRSPLTLPTDGTEALLNPALARQLNVQPGDELLLRVQKPNALSGDISLTPREDTTATLQLRVAGILPAEAGGNFSLLRSQLPPLNLFVPRELLAATAGLAGKANLLVTGPAPENGGPMAASAALDEGLRRSWQLEDAALALPVLTNRSGLELRTTRVFLDPPVVEAAQAAVPGNPPRMLLTYLANTLESATQATPYSFVTAVGPPLTPEDLGPDEVVVNQWLADDLGLRPGDTLRLTYFLPESGARLTEATNTFRVRSIVPLEPPWDDRSLMPDFPGVEKAESTRDWEFGFELEHEIRPKDEEYWQQRRGTPKAFISLAAGQKLWGNRFGEVTALRWGVDVPDEARDGLARSLQARLDPRALGLQFEPVRTLALQGAAQAQDFGQLFIGFSFFLVAAALLLMGLLFQFGLEQRAGEVGTLLALGFKPAQVRRLLLWEGAALAFLGGLLGLLGGLAYSQAMLRGLTTVWRDAIGASSLQFHATPRTLVIGLLAGTLVAMITLWVSLRKQARRPARELLAEGAAPLDLAARSRGAWMAGSAGLAALGLVTWVIVTGQTANAGAFFGAGALLLVAGLAATSAWLARLARPHETRMLTRFRVGVRGAARRRKRSVATVALLACGCFVIVAVGAFRLDAARETAKGSGTGGFAFLGETTLPVFKDLNTEEGRDYFALSEREMAGVQVVPFRVRRGDDASCLNLNRAQRPRLLGVNPERMAGRFTFTAAARGLSRDRGWELLRAETGPDEVPAIGDAASIQWALGKKVGDTLDYTDERGRTFKLRLVGAVANSVLQGNLVVDESKFLARYPGESGYRMFLVDTTGDRAALRERLSRALQDVGLELAPAVDRLNAFNAVQNTYLGTFQFLGGLGLLLGSAGLGIVVLRNVLERRGELGLFTALGFRPRALLRLVLAEHLVLLIWGLGLGIVAAVVAVLPAILTPGAQLPYGSLAATLLAVLANGLVWTWAASRFALRGNLLAALRNE